MILCAKQVQPISIRTNVQRAVAAKYGLGNELLKLRRYAIDVREALC